jgi:hypothetical protein
VFRTRQLGALAVSLKGDGLLSTPNLSSWFTNETQTIELLFNAAGEGSIIDERGQLVPGGWAASLLDISADGEVRARMWGLPTVDLGAVSFHE